jgi:Tat protein secretion system quality control protein TatD with DNase activity
VKTTQKQTIKALFFAKPTENIRLNSSNAVPNPEISAVQLELLIAIGFNPERAKNCLLLADKFLNVYATTDAPYLAPILFRGKPNRPEFVRQTLETLAMVRKLEFAEIERITSANARVVYGIF